MPLYDFVCDKCGLRAEHVMSMDVVGTDKQPVFICPGCDKPLRKVISVVQIRMKKPEFKRTTSVKRDMAQIEEIMSEPVDPSEVKAGNDMLKEREKTLGYEEGRLTGTRPRKDPKDPDFIKDSKSRVQDAKAARGQKY